MFLKDGYKSIASSRENYKFAAIWKSIAFK